MEILIYIILAIVILLFYYYLFIFLLKKPNKTILDPIESREKSLNKTYNLIFKTSEVYQELHTKTYRLLRLYKGLEDEALKSAVLKQIDDNLEYLKNVVLPQEVLSYVSEIDSFLEKQKSDSISNK